MDLMVQVIYALQVCSDNSKYKEDLLKKKKKYKEDQSLDLEIFVA